MNSEQNRIPSSPVAHSTLETVVLAHTHKRVSTTKIQSVTYMLSRLTPLTDMNEPMLSGLEIGDSGEPHYGLIEDFYEDHLNNAPPDVLEMCSRVGQVTNTFTTNGNPIYDLTASDSDNDETTMPSFIPANSSSYSVISDITNVDFDDNTISKSTLFSESTTSAISKSTLFSESTTTSGSKSSYYTALTSPYDCTRFSEQQITAAKEVIQHFEDGPSRWVMLFAQMQSGKTDTFLLVGCEMRRLERINKIIVFSGNAETDLRDQLKRQIDSSESKFYIKYRNYLQTLSPRPSEDDIEDIIEQSIDHIEVLWGQDLLKKRKHQDRKTLFIWEESHFAQSVNNRPYKFLKMVGISADGNIEASSGKYCLSVSATPFSEMVDNVRKEQEKPVVYMRPGEGYWSVDNIMKSGKLKSFEDTDVTKGLATALDNAKYKSTSPKYAVIRCSCKNITKIQKTLYNAGWTCVEYDSKTTETIGEITWNSMDKQPSRNTAILIRGRCRMGKNIDKTHLAFVFEPTIDTNTDTALQGLLGRVCGYSKGSSDVEVWISSKLKKSEELDKYIGTVNTVTNPKGPSIIPGRGMNLVAAQSNQRNKFPILPIRFDNVTGGGSSRSLSFMSMEEDIQELHKQTKAFFEPGSSGENTRFRDTHINRETYINPLREFIDDEHIPNAMYSDFITRVCGNCVSIDEETGQRGRLDMTTQIRYKIEVHDVCKQLEKKESGYENKTEASTEKWLNLIPKLKATKITSEKLIRDMDIPVPANVEEAYIWDTYAKSNAFDKSKKSKKECSKTEREGYIVHLFVFTKNPVHMLKGNKLNPIAKQCIQSFSESDSSKLFGIPANTMFLWGVVDYPEGVNTNRKLPSTTGREVFGHALKQQCR